ncbi:MAG: cation:proton antiporter subunit C [Bacilli bacterium]|nr:cation:proton antiporter subunit C [Bacilli bacterium]
MDFNNLVNNYVEVVAVILFGIGFSLLLFNKNLIKKIMGLNIMDTGIYLFLASMGYIEGKWAPVLNNGSTNPVDYINPIPAGLVLTGIVVSVSVTSIMLALTVRLYKRYKSLDLDEIYSIVYSEHDEKEVK